MSASNINKEKVESIVQKIIEIEKENLNTNELTKTQIVNEIKKIIESEVGIE